ncbi:hypothetical protein CDAR_98261 [Caerostris darwini]|uniref:Uncharacterized protein n=1 Tax=Caerostris darwini TaxID=1538125 RepID=A0AAV4UFY2_9ARAC|nr:hypothetical protein CDAR_98261 [Caerostris darwini]
MTEDCELLVGAGGYLPCNIFRCRPEVVVIGSFDTICVCTLFEEELFGKLDSLAAHYEVASGTVELYFTMAKLEIKQRMTLC